MGGGEPAFGVVEAGVGKGGACPTLALAAEEASRRGIRDYLLVVPTPPAAGARGLREWLGPGRAAFILYATENHHADGVPGPLISPYCARERTYPVPRRCPREVVFAASTQYLSFRFVLRALGHGARWILYASADGFARERLSTMLARKVADRLGASVQRLVYRLARSAAANARLRQHGFLSSRLGRVISAVRERREIRIELPAPILTRSAFVPGRVILANSALAWGGAERQIVYTLAGVHRAGVESVRLVCQRIDEPDENLRFYLPEVRTRGIPVEQLLPIECAHQVLTRCCTEQQRVAIRTALNGLPDDVRGDVRRFLAEFVQSRPWAVHAWQDATNIAAGIAAALAGVPRIVLSARNVSPPNFAYHRPYMRSAYRALLGFPGVVFTNNSDAGAMDYAAWLGIPQDRIIVLRNGIDVGAFAAPSRKSVEAFRSTYGIGPEEPLVGSVFRFYPEKRPLLWIDAAKHIARAMPETRFLVLGAGPLLGEVLRRAERVGIAQRLVLPGALSEVKTALASMDVFLLTSRHEGTPNVLLEAQLLGVPVVTTGAGGAAEALLHGETGYCVREARARALAGKVVSVLRDREFRERVRTAGPRFVERRFGLDRMIGETMALYGLDSRAHARRALGK